MSGFNTMSEKKSYRGVYYNIEDSDICVLFNGIYLYFCSQAIADHFEKNYPTFKEKALKRLKSILPTVGMENIDLALGLEYYRIIEKRGYRAVTFAGVPIKQAHLIGDVEFDVEEE